MLSKKTQYAIHALTYLAAHDTGKPAQVAEIASVRQVSIKFLESILLELRKAGILGSKKGKGGGYYMIKAPEQVQLITVIRLLDGPIAMLPCVSLNYYERCEMCDEETCQLRRVMGTVRDATLKILQNTTVKDLIGRTVEQTDFSI
ncbi:MAG: Rrf2 family transcriptional regulator [Mucilaginibacter polytrichastri]|nr:Rrf2 family transcriptional regulator [Mucilaginibacter polytrichastri]